MSKERVQEPPLPKDFDSRELPRGVRAELRGLSSELAEQAGAHLLMAGRSIDADPALALEHAQAAKRRAGRLPIVREAVGEAAYAAGEFALALSEFRAVRRMTGSDAYLAAMADCERALRRPQAALKLVREGLAASPEADIRVELRLVEAGLRTDSGQVPEALRLLQTEIEDLGARGTKVGRARLRYAYADLLERTGAVEQAERWFAAAARLDPDESTDAADRLASLRGIVIEFDEDELLEDELEEDEEAADEHDDPAEDDLDVPAAQDEELSDEEDDPAEVDLDTSDASDADEAEDEGEPEPEADRP
ncbi:hypothetical protein ATK74_1047 [Propionicimonas paludicola]|uniref:Tetratricopeptide repeat protein n=1 Tax=Propionicimonas paludicola TaxID=185243 RepID=A0A2A9CSC1_9ACTN|nr:hypothetical protein [Propionicimonas paludicola]PFG16502.1 hypothetical protein ATK74_1047 [Propionicimonas paludicola]